MDKKNKLTYYYVEDNMGDIVQKLLENDDTFKKELKAQIRKKRIDEICEHLSQTLSPKEVERIRRIAERMSDEKFEELEQKSKDLLNMMDYIF